MRLFDIFKDVYVGELTTQEQGELAKFASALLQAKYTKSASAASAIIKQAAERIHDPEDYEHIANLCLYLSKHAASINRSGFDWQKASDYVLKGGVLASALAPILGPVIQRHRQARKHDAAFKEVVREHPSLGGNALATTKRHFDVLKTFAPDVASNSLVAGNVLHRMHRLGPGMMDVNQVKELASTQSQLKGVGSSADSLRSVGDLLKTVGEGIKPGDPQKALTDSTAAENKFLATMLENDKLRDDRTRLTAKLRREADFMRARNQVAKG